MSGISKSGYGGASLGPLQGSSTERVYTADMCAPASTGMPVETAAVVAPDGNSATGAVREFAATGETGMCLHLRIPADVTSMRLRIPHRAKVAPVENRSVVARLYTKVGDENWSGPQALSLIAVPDNEFIQSITVAATLIALGLMAGDEASMLFARNADSPNDDFENPWLIYEIGVSFE